MSRSPQILLLVWLGFVESLIQKLPESGFKSHACMFLFTSRVIVNNYLVDFLNLFAYIWFLLTVSKIDQTLNLFFALATKSFPMVLLYFFLYNWMKSLSKLSSSSLFWHFCPPNQTAVVVCRPLAGNTVNFCLRKLHFHAAMHLITYFWQNP